jgi:hypothetical protein
MRFLNRFQNLNLAIFNLQFIKSTLSSYELDVLNLHVLNMQVLNMQVLNMQVLDVKF